MLRRCAFRKMLAPTSAALGRFIPPWEKEGRTADEYFGGLLRSSNPLQKARRDRQRHEEELAAVEELEAQEKATDLSSRQLRDAKRSELMEKAADAAAFLPYGAKPAEYSKLTELPTWGTYQDKVLGASGYSDDAKLAMIADAETALPYKYDTTPELRRGEQPQWPLHGTAGFVLDIDGVVYRSKQMLPGSADAIKQLLKLKIPMCFMTNGGGVTEEKKAAELSHLIGVDVTPDMVLMAHTPMQLLAARYANQNVLIVGPSGCLEAARRYGFKRAIHMEDFQAEHPELVPFKRWPPGIVPKAPNSVPYPEIAAVFAFTDSLDALNDIQVIIDVVTSPFGMIGSAVSAQQTVPVYISADDLLWATNAKLPRLGMGAFREMLAATYESVTGSSLQVVQYGKPRGIAYRFAHQRLQKLSKGLGWDPRALRTICMIGDNLETDIIGANAAGGPWMSVHVMTGIGSAPSAVRTLSPGDEEAEWLQQHVSKTPHYVAPSLDHFVREMLAFGEEAITMNRTKSYGPPCPADWATYNFDPFKTGY